MNPPNAIAYVVDDFIYKSTLGRLYNFSRPWIRDLDPHDKEVKNPYNKRRIAYLYYRPRVEAQALARPVAYEHMVTLRLRRLPEERALLIDDTLTRAEQSIISQEISHVPNWKKLIEYIYATAYRLNSTINPLPPDWKPTHDDILTRVRTHNTNYITLIKNFRNQPAAGLAWLTIRRQTDDFAAELLTQHFGAWRRKRIPAFDTYTKRPVAQ